MKFGAIPVSQAQGAVVVHTIRQGALILKKGSVIGEADIVALREAGIVEIVVARLESGDVEENCAAHAIAHAAAGDHVTVEKAFTGRCNLFAKRAGILLLERTAVDALNRVDESITFATLPAFKAVVEGEMVATAKIVPFAVAGRTQRRALQTIGRPLLKIAPYRVKNVGVISTLLPGLDARIVEKTLRITKDRLSVAGARIVGERRVSHIREDVANALHALQEVDCELIIVFGASAISDRHDVIPAALELAGGTIVNFGMPVDPGNLLLLGDLRGRPVIGAPGCARSPKENGFDWILMRLLAKIPVTREDIAGLGVGGLLMEIVTRPQLRDRSTSPVNKRIGALVLAAGRSSRMGGTNKLLAEIDGEPLVRLAAAQAVNSKAHPVIVVTGHEREKVEAALKDMDVVCIDNPRFSEGLSTSLKAGLAAMPSDIDGVIVCLADMPRVDAALIDRTIGAFDPDKNALVVVPTVEGKRGNPVLWSRQFFRELSALEGDVGARHLIGRYSEVVVELPIAGRAPLVDIDTMQALQAEQTERDD